MRIRLTVVLATVASFLIVPGAFAHEAPLSPTVSLLGKGMVSGSRWTVEAVPEGSGICLEVGVFTGHSPLGETGRGQCSYPAVRRGILLVEPNRQMKTKKPPAMTAVGAAFNPAVKKVMVRLFNGRSDGLHLSRVRTKKSGSVGRFKYAAFAVSGPWCAKTLTTYGSGGHVLWSVNWKVFDAGWRSDPASNPAVLCNRS